MDNRVIGIFDSGLGGLTAVRELSRIMPEERFVFFGDTARNPYGSRTKPELTAFGRQNIAFLRSFSPKAIVVACGTISANALSLLQAENDLPIFGVIEPAVSRTVSLPDVKNIGIIATEASIKSRAYEKRLSEAAPELKIIPRACPLFVPLVEHGKAHTGIPETESAVRDYLSPMKGKIDTLILGCTHYPLLADPITEYLGNNIRLIDVGAESVKALSDFLGKNNLRAHNSTLSNRYFVSGNPEFFAHSASEFLGHDISEQVEQVDITKY